eukprot:gene3972-632_t
MAAEALAVGYAFRPQDDQHNMNMCEYYAEFAADAMAVPNDAWRVACVADGAPCPARSAEAIDD